jgi:tRNA threonylcarbamoyladenosine biosynthesis protein TsaE
MCSREEQLVTTTVITHNENETIKEAEKLGKTLVAGNVVALYGGLGTGKTTFTRGLALGLGISMSVSSPTFTIVNEYHGTVPLFHFDMYRLESDDELFDIGWDDYLQRGGICVVEWSEKVPGAFPPDTIIVRLENYGGTTRRIDITS